MSKRKAGARAAPTFVVRAEGGSVTFRVHVRPGSAREHVGGVDPWRHALLVHVQARAERGEANAAVCAALAKRLGIPPGSVAIEHGATSRDKVVRVGGAAAAAVEALGEARG